MRQEHIMNIVQTDTDCKIIFRLQDLVLKAQCDDIYDCGLVARVRATYRNRTSSADDDLVDTVCIQLAPNAETNTLNQIIRHARLTLYHSE
jgi:hypothetical protein